MSRKYTEMLRSIKLIELGKDRRVKRTRNILLPNPSCYILSYLTVHESESFLKLIMSFLASTHLIQSNPIPSILFPFLHFYLPSFFIVLLFLAYFKFTLHQFFVFSHTSFSYYSNISHSSFLTVYYSFFLHCILRHPFLFLLVIPLLPYPLYSPTVTLVYCYDAQLFI